METRSMDESSQLREIIDRALSRVNTCIPGRIDSFDAATQTCSVTPAVSLKVQTENGISALEYPTITNAPLITPYAAGKGFSLTTPIAAGDPCLILFSQRAIDNWHDKGGVQASEDGISSRHHHLTDALVLPTAITKSNAIQSWNSDGIEIRNADRTTRIHVGDDKIELLIGDSNIVINADGSIDIQAATSLNINAETTMTMTTTSGLSIGMDGSGGFTLTVPGTLNINAATANFSGGAHFVGGIVAPSFTVG